MNKIKNIKMTKLYESIEEYNKRKLKELDSSKKIEIRYNFPSYEQMRREPDRYRKRIYLSQPLSLFDNRRNGSLRDTAMKVLDFYYCHGEAYCGTKITCRLRKGRNGRDLSDIEIMMNSIVDMSNSDIIVFMPRWIEDAVCRRERGFAESHNCKIMEANELNNIMRNYNFSWNWE